MNVLIIMSDEHSYNAMGCAGHSLVKTPALDRLAEEGTVFHNCYTPGPVCVPARASMFTGKHSWELGTWDNGTPYDGKVKGMFQHFKENGMSFTSVGKLDFHCDGTYPA